MPFPSPPNFPDDDPVEALRMLRNYVRLLLDYFSPLNIGIGLLALAAVGSVLVYYFANVESVISWGAEFVPMAFAVVGIVFSVKKLREEHHFAVIALLIIVGVFGTVVLHLSRTHAETKHSTELGELRNRMDTVRDQNGQLLTAFLSKPPLSSQEAELERRRNIEKLLRGEYILSHDNISPGLLAGTEFPPTEWMNRRLQELGEKWNVLPTPEHAVSQRSYLVFDGPPRIGERKDDKGNVLPNRNFFEIGDPLAFNYTYKNSGPNSIELMQYSRWVSVRSDYSAETQRQLMVDFKNLIRKEDKEHPIKPHVVSTLMPGESRWATVYASEGEDRHSRLILQADLDGFQHGTEIPFVIIEMAYLDKKEIHHLRTCAYLQSPAVSLIWHFCDDFTKSD